MITLHIRIAFTNRMPNRMPKSVAEDCSLQFCLFNRHIWFVLAQSELSKLIEIN